MGCRRAPVDRAIVCRLRAWARFAPLCRSQTRERLTGAPSTAARKWEAPLGLDLYATSLLHRCT
eukprot:7272672-Prymnesium_polylepis.1